MLHVGGEIYFTTNFSNKDVAQKNIRNSSYYGQKAFYLKQILNLIVPSFDKRGQSLRL